MEIKRWSFELYCTDDMKIGIGLPHKKPNNVDRCIHFIAKEDLEL